MDTYYTIILHDTKRLTHVERSTVYVFVINAYSYNRKAKRTHPLLQARTAFFFCFSSSEEESDVPGESSSEDVSLSLSSALLASSLEPALGLVTAAEPGAPTPAPGSLFGGVALALPAAFAPFFLPPFLPRLAFLSSGGGVPAYGSVEGATLSKTPAPRVSEG